MMSYTQILSLSYTPVLSLSLPHSTTSPTPPNLSSPPPSFFHAGLRNEIKTGRPFQMEMRFNSQHTSAILLLAFSDLLIREEWVHSTKAGFFFFWCSRLCVCIRVEICVSCVHVQTLICREVDVYGGWADTGWRRLIASPKLQIIFHKRATTYRSLLRKMTYKDKGSYESSPPFML